MASHDNAHARGIVQGVLFASLASIVVFVGLWAGNHQDRGERKPFLDVFTGIDGAAYNSICRHGYSFTRGTPSTVAFFPAYPFMSALLAHATGWSDSVSLILLSNGFYLLAAMAFGSYLRVRVIASHRHLSASTTRSDRCAMMALAFYPPSVFCRFAYSESLSLFLFVCCLSLIVRRRSLILAAVIAGLAAATRSVGIVLILPLTVAVYRQSHSMYQFIGRCLYIIPIAAWGLIAFMLMQYVKFGTPFAFVETQAYFRYAPKISVAQRAMALASWEPVRAVYDSTSLSYWKTIDHGNDPLDSLAFANPIYFMFAIALITLGGFRRWLNMYEVLLSAQLLIVPYLLRGYEMQMQSQARFTVVVVPLYICMGRVLSRMHWLATAAILLSSCCLLTMYAKLYASGHPML